MKEKELRIALVCSGGISLSIYMHGISKEILKLVRASKSLHSIDDRIARSDASFFDYVDVTDPEYDTDAIYFELLQHLGRDLELRVVVDVIAGASAAASTGQCRRAPGAICLWGRCAKLAQSCRCLRSSCARGQGGGLEQVVSQAVDLDAGCGRTMAVDQGPGSTPKTIAFCSLAMVRGTAERIADGGAHAQCDAAMGNPRNRMASLVPPEQGLDLFVTLTDQFGYQQPLSTHTPPIIYELEHRHVLRFRYDVGAMARLRATLICAMRPRWHLRPAPLRRFRELSACANR